MFAVTGGKGGTGKTTTTLGLARALADEGTETLAIDADWDLPDLGEIACGQRRSEHPNGSSDPPALGSAVSDDARSDARILPAPASPNDADLERTVRTAVSAGPADAAVLLDCPAGAAPDAVAPLRVADAAILVTEPCTAALRAAAKTGAMARTLGTPVAGAVVTRATVVPPGVRDLLDCPILARVPRISPPVLDSDRARTAYATAAATLVDGPESALFRGV